MNRPEEARAGVTACDFFSRSLLMKTLTAATREERISLLSAFNPSRFSAGTNYGGAAHTEHYVFLHNIREITKVTEVQYDRGGQGKVVSPVLISKSYL